MNINPSLIMGLALAHAEKQPGAELRPGDKDQAELRLYPNNGSGFWFIRAYSPGRWYYKDEVGADHFNRAEQSDVDAAIKDGARVQLTGYHGKSLALWRTWEDFEKAVS